MVETRVTTDLKIDGTTARDMPLATWGEISTARDGRMETRGHESWRNQDAGLSTGVWECDAGRFQASFKHAGELVTILSGELVCTADDGTVTTLRPGDSMTFPRGWSGEWHAKAPVRNLYVSFRER